MRYIHQIVDQCEVSMSDREVIREIVSRIEDGYDAWKYCPRQVRRDTMRAAIARHHANQKLYAFVMGGGK